MTLFTFYHCFYLLISLSFFNTHVQLISLVHGQPHESVSSSKQQHDKEQEEEFITSDMVRIHKKLHYSKCMDLRDSCSQWAELGECTKNPAYMGPHCPYSCHTCSLLQPRTALISFSKYQPQTLYQSGWEFPDAIGRDLGEPQLIYDRNQYTRSIERIQLARQHVQLYYNQQEQHEDFMIRWSLCQNHSPNCTTWALAGECLSNPNYMQQQCAPVCFTCFNNSTILPL